MAADDPLKGVKSMLRAVLLSSKEGVLASRLQGEYRGITGEIIPFRKHGFNSLDQFMFSMPDVVRLGRNKEGLATYFAVADESTSHIEKMVARQRSTKKSGKIGKRTFRKPTYSYGMRRPSAQFGPSSRISPRFMCNFPSQPFLPQMNKNNSGYNVFGQRSMAVARRFQKQGLSTISHTVDAEQYESKPVLRPLLPLPRPSSSATSHSGLGQPPMLQFKDMFTCIGSYKEVLHKFTQKHESGIPHYTVSLAGSTPLQGFVCSVEYKGETFTSDHGQSFRSKRDAEQAAARAVCKEMNIKIDDVKMLPSKLPKTKFEVSKKPVRNTMTLGRMSLGFEDDDEDDEDVYDSYFDDLATAKKDMKNFSVTVPNDLCPLPNEQLIKERLKDILSGRTNGLWETRIPVEYKERHSEELPAEALQRLKDWTDVARAEKFGANNLCIFYPVVPTTPSNLMPKPPLQSSVNVTNNQSQSQLQPPSSQTQKNTSSMPTINSVIKVFVTHVTNERHLFLQKTDTNIIEIMEEISRAVEMGEVTEPLDQYQPGTPCLAWFSEDNAYYRAEIRNDVVEDMVRVCYIDYGNEAHVPKDKVKKIPKKFCRHQRQSICCAMYQVLPFQWNTACHNEFCILTGQGEVELKAIIVDMRNGVCFVDLFLPILPNVAVPSMLPLNTATMVLPTTDFWDVYICFVNDSPEDIKVRLVGDKYSKKLEILEEELTEYCQNNGHAHVVQCKEGHVYAVYSTEKNKDANSDTNTDTANRVKVKSIKGSQAECLWVDHGDIETLKISDLLYLKPEHLYLPFQAIDSSLSGLEHNEPSEKFIDELYKILGNVYVAEVVERGSKMSMILHDTEDADNEVNVNDKLSEYIMDEELAPKLPEVGETIECYVSYVTETGKLFIQPTGTGLERLNELMEEIQIHYAKKISADEFVSKPEIGKVVGVQYSTDGCWYRAVIKALLPERKIQVHFVDYGNMEVVSQNMLRELWKANRHMSKLPFQAIECDLSKLPPIGRNWTEASVLRLTELTPCDVVFHVKILYKGARNTLPSVELLYKDGTDFVSVNDMLYKDDYLFIPGATYTPQLALEELQKSPDNAKSPIVPESTAIAKDASHSRHDEIPSPSAGSAPEETFVYSDMPLPPPLEIPDVRACWDIHVSWVSDPSNFACTPYETVEVFNSLKNEMFRFYQHAPHQTLDKLDLEQLYAGLYDNVWYRVRISVNYSDKVSVYFVDKGDYTLIKTDNIQPLAAQFRELPCQATRCKMGALKPYSEDGWSDKARARFYKLVNGKDLVAIILAKIDNIISVKLYDTGTEQDLDMDDFMINDQLAVAK